MENHIEQYQARQGGVTLHTWTEVQGWKQANFYITGVSGAPVPCMVPRGAASEASGRYHRLSV